MAAPEPEPPGAPALPLAAAPPAGEQPSLQHQASAMGPPKASSAELPLLGAFDWRFSFARFMRFVGPGMLMSIAYVVCVWRGRGLGGGALGMGVGVGGGGWGSRW
jgi:hypothetical protein